MGSKVSKGRKAQQAQLDRKANKVPQALKGSREHKARKASPEQTAPMELMERKDRREK
jgi:hypothetical protein